MPRTWYLLLCRVCNPPEQRPLMMPFESAAERGRWAAAHRAGTGHDSWLVLDQTDDVPRLVDL